jgi:IS5 family transposase
MLKEEPKQAKFVYGPAVYENVIEEDHILKKLDESIDWSRVDTICRSLYCEDNGRPVTNFPRRMFKAEILQFKYNWSDREMEEQARYNIVVKWFLELDIDEKPFDHSALTKFRAKLGAKKHSELFLDILKQIKEAGLLDNKKQSIDASAVDGDIAVLGTIELIKKGCFGVIREMKEKNHDACIEFEKKESVESVVKKALKLLKDSEPIQGIEHGRNILQSILDDNITITENEIKKRKKKGKGRIVSPVDEDVTFGAKSKHNTWAGFKLHLMMTKKRFITSISLTTACVTDDKEAVHLLDQQEEPPDTVTGDGLYGTGDNWRDFEERDCMLVAPVRGQENKTGLYPKTEFAYDKETKSITCPAQKTTTTYTKNEKTKAFVYRFSQKDCQNCKLKSQCTTGKYRSVSISFYHEEFEKARKFNETEDYKTLQEERKQIESKFAEMKNIHGLKRARYRGLERVTIQAILTAIVVNLKNFIRLLFEQVTSQKSPAG